ncbi:MAG: DedA family protein [Prevotellaceae bacterium]|nr:DedA family protein [Prevotellaceae bacterium]
MQSLPFIAWCLGHLNYWVIVCLMAIESSFIPFPSEVVIPPAAYLAASHQGGLNVFLVVVFGTLGALLGAFVNYGLALWLGRPIVYSFAGSRLGRLCLLDKAKVETAERYFVRHGKLATLVGRLVPAVRQLISIPAGLARMSLGKFALYTAIGAGVWNTVLAAIGYWLAGVVPYDELDATVAHYELYVKLLMVLIGLAAVAYLIYKGIGGKR